MLINGLDSIYTVLKEFSTVNTEKSLTAESSTILESFGELLRVII